MAIASHDVSLVRNLRVDGNWLQDGRYVRLVSELRAEDGSNFLQLLSAVVHEMRSKHIPLLESHQRLFRPGFGASLAQDLTGGCL